MVFFRPGDTPWINDEPILIAAAISLNHAPSHDYGIDLPFTIATRGPQSTRGGSLGPGATWIYQVLTSITHDPIWLVRLRAGVVAVTLAFAISWLLKSLGASRWLVVVIMLSPWIWIYTRQLWDNSFCVPLSALAFAAYADFLSAFGRRSLLTALATCFALLLVHFMSVPLAAAIVLHAVIFRWRQILRYKWSVLTLVFLGFLIALPFARVFLSTYSHSIKDAFGWRSLLVPFYGPNHLTAAGIGGILSDSWTDFAGPYVARTIQLAAWISRSAYLVCWAGILLALGQLFRRPTEQPAENLKRQLSIVALATLGFSIMLDRYEQIPFIPSYLNGIWIIFPFFAWLVLDWVKCRFPTLIPLKRALITLHAACLAIVLCAMLAAIARDHGAYTPSFGTVLSDQVRAVETIRKYNILSPVDVRLTQWLKYPWEKDVLMLLLAQPRDDKHPSEGRFNLPTAKLIVRYRGDFPGDAAIVVDVKPPPAGGFQ
jgi:hypothetical protein